MTERMISPQPGDEDRDEYSLRPKRLREFIGQPTIKQRVFRGTHQVQCARINRRKAGGRRRRIGEVGLMSGSLTCQNELAGSPWGMNGSLDRQEENEMIVTLSPHTGALLQEQSGRFGQDTDALADALLQQALEDAARDYEETCQAIAEGLADVEAGRTISFEEALARRDAQKAARRSHARDAA